jgi:D-serine deaminase-like pyridoxal phosphate-dependent protein
MEPMEQAIADMSRTETAQTLETLETPCLVLDVERMERNISRLRTRLDGLGVSLRPHLKTAKSVEVARRVMTTPEGPATVSTLKEAEQFAAAGVRDMIYAVGITPSKLARVLELRANGVDLVVILDNVDQARAVAEASVNSGTRIPAMIEIDCDGHRSGVAPSNHALLLEIGQTLAAGAELRGVLTHAGDSYKGGGPEAQERFAEAERAAVVEAAQVLHASGLPCPVVSVGSTPTAHHAVDLTGVTEVRAGVFVFFDLFMTGVGICQVDDIAMSVMATVIGHQREKGWIITDGGWMSLSRDRGTAKQAVDQGYGLVCDIEGNLYRDIMVVDANQEHGIIAVRPGSGAQLPDLAVGDRVRILPNHACATGAQHDAYHVVRGKSHAVESRWSRFGGW